ncbi:MAG TPA: pitrilysin family protein [Polyangiaceae bacterium]|nr:pitrilysin family protein [Polyangiaceae bacterium]
MNRTSWFASLLVAALVACACGGEVKTYQAKPPAAPAPTSTVPPDPEPWRSERPKPGQPGELHFPVPNVVKLQNGLSVYLVQRPTAVISFDFVIKHGGSAVPDGKSGLAALTARMLVESTKKHPSRELAEAAENLGSPLTSNAGRDESTVSLSALTSDADRALALLAEVVREPSFDPKDFERVRAEWVDQLVGERQAPERLASLAGLRLLNGPVLGAPVSGGVTDVKRLRIADLKEFHAHYYLPSEAALVVVGNVGFEALRPSLDKYFGSWRAAAKPPKAAEVKLPPPNPGLRLVAVDRPGAVQTAIFAAQRFPQRSAPGFESRSVLGEIVGGLFTSRINMNLREKHAWTYGAVARPVATRDWGAFVLSTSVRTDATAPALSEALHELQLARDPSLGKPLMPDEIERGKAALLHELGARLEHGSLVAGSMVELFSQALGNDYYTRYPELVKAVTPADLEAGQRLLAPEDLLVVVVGDLAQIRPGFDKLGWKLELADDALTD